MSILVGADRVVGEARFTIKSREARQGGGNVQTDRPDVAALRQAIDERLRGRAAFSERTYGDQPIVFSGRQLKSYVPQPLSDARALAHSPELTRHSEAYVFWRQAVLLADYEDDYDFRGHFSRYYPTYEVMSNDQLRGYFAWRTGWRAGAAPATETSFIYVFAYELLMGIGVTDPREGYDALARLSADYGDGDERIAQNLARWMDDYVIYWDLPADLLGGLAHREADAALGVLLHRQDHSDEELFAAMTALSSYHVEKSAFYREHGDDLRRVATKVYRAMADHHDRKLTRSLVETYFGVSAEQDYLLFPNAVFFDQRRYEDFCYEVSHLDHFHCHQGRWSRDRYAGNLRPNKKLGALLKTVDATMRELYGFKPALQAPLKTKYVLKLIKDETAALLEARAEAERRAVHIDLSKLGGIRAAADKTRDSLLVDEEEVEELFPTRGEGLRAQGDGVRLGHAPLPTCPQESAAAELGLRPQTVLAPAASFGRVSSAMDPVIPRPPVPGGPLVKKASPTIGPGAEHDPRTPLPPEPAADSSVLTPDERACLRIVLDGGSLRDFERERHAMASLLIDSINEKLFDDFGDVVIDAGSEPPVAYDDYVDDMRGLLDG